MSKETPTFGKGSKPKEEPLAKGSGGAELSLWKTELKTSNPKPSMRPTSHDNTGWPEDKKSPEVAEAMDKHWLSDWVKPTDKPTDNERYISPARIPRTDPKPKSTQHSIAPPVGKSKPKKKRNWPLPLAPVDRPDNYVNKNKNEWPRDYWSTDEKKLIRLFLFALESDELPQGSFQLNQWTKVLDSKVFYEWLKSQCQKPPGTGSQIYGTLIKTLMHLKARMNGHPIIFGHW